jgi:nucleotide-binding universal stress UspA family protein
MPARNLPATGLTKRPLLQWEKLMYFKCLLSVVSVEQSDDDLKVAITLCSQFNAQLSVMVIAVAPSQPIDDGNADIWLKERHEDLEILNKRVDEVNAIMKTAEISATVIDEYPESARISRVIGKRARYTDIMIIGPDLLGNKTLKTKTIVGGLFESGRPVLIVPRGSTATLWPKCVLLAWDSGVECTRAAREALDIMASAEKVHVTMIDPDTNLAASGPEPGADIAAYLARHGIKVTVDRLPSGGNSVADVLKQHATDISADLIIMGGYGHSRMRERIFGGVTKSMIDEPGLPILMAH